MAIKGILFDCFGVLVGRGFWDLYCVAGGDTLKDAEFIENLLARANSGHMTQAEFHSAVCEQIGISESAWQACVAREEHINQDLVDYIAEKLKPAYTLGVLSNANTGVVERRLGETTKLFDCVVVSADVGLLKPDPRVFALACERLGLAPQEVVMVDDAVDNCAGAQASGLHAIHYRDVEQLKQDLQQLTN
jgi:epoxide hydrolase-like predicted phosphatase